MAPPDSGFGQLWRKEFSLVIPNSPDATTLMAYWKEHLYELWPNVSHLYRSSRDMQDGDLVGLDMGVGPAKLATGVVVTDSDDTGLTLLSPEGHIFSGWTRLAVFDTEDGTLATITVEMRASDPLYEAGLLVGGHAIEERFWSDMLRDLSEKISPRPKVRLVRTQLDKRRQWRHLGNIRNNAFILTVVRRLGRLVGVGSR